MLELGCGVGWLAATLARELDRDVVGVDLHPEELEVARRAFGGDGRVRFLEADVLTESLDQAPFDTVVLAATLQYFADPKALLDRLASCVAPGGEVVILDTPIYDDHEVEAARARSRDYYQNLGVPEMIDHYFHHSWSHLGVVSPQVLYRPRRLRSWIGRRFGRRFSPFPILRIQLGRPGR